MFSLKTCNSCSPYFSRFHQAENTDRVTLAVIFEISLPLAPRQICPPLLPCLRYSWKSSGSHPLSLGTVTGVITQNATGGQQLPLTLDPSPGEDAAIGSTAFGEQKTLQALQLYKDRWYSSSMLLVKLCHLGFTESCVGT